MIAYRAMADVPKELVRYVGQLIAVERRARGTRAGATVWSPVAVAKNIDHDRLPQLVQRKRT